MHTTSLLVWWFSHLLTACAGVVAAFSFPALILVGDSTLDTGNNNFLSTIFKCNHSPYGRDYYQRLATGRWSDGFMALDYVAQELGLPSPIPYLDPNADGSAIVTGINLASGGAGVLDATSQAVGIAKLSKQITWYFEYQSKLKKVIGESRALYILSNALYVISVGTNDYLVNFYLPPGVPHPGNVSEFRSSVLHAYENSLEMLYQGGARTIVAVGIPPMGCLPYTMAFYNAKYRSGFVDYMNTEAEAFNQGLKTLLSDMSIRLPGIKLLYIDTYTTIFKIVNSPQDFGFKVTTRGCCGNGIFAFGPTCSDLSFGTCQNTEDYVFFDAIHPAQRTGKIVADSFLSQLKNNLV